MATKKLSPFRIFRWVLPFFVIAILFWTLSQMFAPTTIYTSEGITLLKGDTVRRAVVNDVTQQVDLTLSKPFTSKQAQESVSLLPFSSSSKQVTFYYSTAQAKQIDQLIQNAEPKKGFNSVVPRDSMLSMFVVNVLPFIIILGFAWWAFGKLQGSGGMMGFGRSRFKQLDAKAPKVKFSDVAGADEAVEELREIQEFLSEPDKFHNLGARIPKGVLLCGPPGTGKTLIAKAVAGEAKVPFFSLSGSEFVEMFVGVGASRVRDLFAQAKAAAPAIIFVDEIDAVGRHRGTGMGGGNDEREQTLNQLLVEMDGFDANTNVILIAATNRPDVLDPALLRPGRFDRQVNVDVPDMKGRVAILKVHAKDKPMTADVDLAMVAKRTPGFSGADLENVLNEAALLTARSNADLIDTRALDEAIDRVIAGPQRRTRIMNDHDKLVTAYHEGGHALCAAALRYSDPVTKVTILPRGRALGYTMVMPSEDRYSRTRNQLLDELVYALGGRVAEELIFEDPSTGASNDIEKATATARRLVTDYGMSAAVGLVKLGKDDTEPFLGRGGVSSRDYSESTAAVVDSEVRNLLDQANREAWELLSRNRAVLDDLAQRLIEKETVLEEELAEIFSKVVKQPERTLWAYGRECAVDPNAIGNPIKPAGDSTSETEETLSSGWHSINHDLPSTLPESGFDTHSD